MWNMNVINKSVFEVFQLKQLTTNPVVPLIRMLLLQSTRPEMAMDHKEVTLKPDLQAFHKASFLKEVKVSCPTICNSAS